MLPYLLETMTDSEADLPQSGLSGSWDLTTLGQALTSQAHEPRSRIIEDPAVYMKTPASSEFRYTYTESISSSQTITSASTNQHLRVYYRHKGQWDNLHTEKRLEWEMLPWPLLKQPTTVEEITADGVEEYLRSLYRLPQNLFGSMEEYVMDHIDR
jgi:hypothetical protein